MALLANLKQNLISAHWSNSNWGSEVIVICYIISNESDTLTEDSQNISLVNSCIHPYGTSGYVKIKSVTFPTV